MIICAESDPLALRLLERQIAKLGQPFLSATTGQQVFAYAQYRGVTLILLSLELADQSGVATLQQLKAAPSTCQLPVVMLARTNEQEGVAYAHGCVVYLVKPFSTLELAQVIRAWSLAAKSGL